MPYSKYVETPISEKLLLSIRETASYSGIGIHKIEELIQDENCNFLILNGNRRMIKREIFRDYINSQNTKSL